MEVVVVVLEVVDVVLEAVVLLEVDIELVEELVVLALLVNVGSVIIHGTGLKNVKFTITPLPSIIGSLRIYPGGPHVHICPLLSGVDTIVMKLCEAL